MEPVVDKLKGFAKSSQDFATNLLQWPPNHSNRRNPVEILKRLQREAFSDLMKLRDRQDKVERVLAFYKPSKGNLFDEATTHVRGEVDVLGALLFIDSIDERDEDAIQRAGIRTGVRSRFTFETKIREKDTLAAELVTSDKGSINGFATPLSLSKVLYAANISDWFSLVGIPMGGRCRDVGCSRNTNQEIGLTDYSFTGPPLLNQHNGSAFGLTVKKPNVVASLAQFVSGFGMPSDSTEIPNSLSTFAQVICQLTKNTKLSLMGLHRVPRSLSQQASLGSMALPVGIFRRHTVPETSADSPDLSMGTNGVGRRNSSGSMALMIDSELDESTRIGGWVEVKNTNTRHLQWAVSMSDTPEDDFGWGLKFGGLVQGPKSWDHFQAEAFLKLNLGKNFSLQPALVYVMDGTTQFPALVLRSSWSL